MLEDAVQLANGREALSLGNTLPAACLPHILRNLKERLPRNKKRMRNHKPREGPYYCPRPNPFHSAVYRLLLEGNLGAYR